MRRAALGGLISSLTAVALRASPSSAASLTRHLGGTNGRSIGIASGEEVHVSPGLLWEWSQRPLDRSSYILYYGGTLGMKKDPTSGALAPAPNFLQAQMEKLPELQAPEMPNWKLVENSELMDSSDMSPAEWNKIARTIGDVYYDYDGFMLIMGTDTMAYCASALSFLFENLGKPVIVTGSQIPLAEVINDARRNLSVSMLIAGNYDIAEVCIFFNNTLLRGNRATKLDNWGFSAFESPNYPVLATLGSGIMLNEDLLRPPPRGRFKVASGLNTNVAVLHLVPGFNDDLVSNLLKPPLQGLIVRSYGSGNAPQKKKEFLRCIQEAVGRGVVVVVCSQCPKGRVDLHKYATGQSLNEAGAISGYDMTIEAAATKLAYLLGKNIALSDVKQQMATELRGELTPLTHVHSIKEKEGRSRL